MNGVTDVNISNKRSKSMALYFLILSVGLIVIIGQFSFVNCTSPYYDLDRQALLDALKLFGIYHDIDLNSYPEERDPILDYKDQYPKYHQLERKGGRAPTLRLRFGRRSDPNWSRLIKSNSQENVN